MGLINVLSDDLLVHRYINELDEESFSVLSQHLDGKSHDVIAANLGISEEEVANLINKACVFFVEKQVEEDHGGEL